MTHRVAGVVHDGQEASDLASGSRLGQGDGASTEGRCVGRDAAEDVAALRLKLLDTDLGGLGGAVDGARGDVVAWGGSGGDGRGSGEDGGDDGELHVCGVWVWSWKSREKIGLVG